jgi:hypothetical protein
MSLQKEGTMRKREEPTNWIPAVNTEDMEMKTEETKNINKGQEKFKERKLEGSTVMDCDRRA